MEVAEVSLPGFVFDSTGVRFVNWAVEPTGLQEQLFSDAEKQL